jgi:branched-chain amino acid transport system substrate-binding protein
MRSVSRVVAGLLLGSVLASPQPAAAETASAQTVKVGVMLPTTGPGAALATQMRAAYELALSHLGGKLGGRDAQLIYVDTQAKPEVARELADELIKSQKVQFITGVLFSNLVVALHAPITQAEVFFIEPIGGPAPLAGARCSNFFFNLSAQNDQVAEAMGMHLAAKQIKKLYAITANYQAGKDMVSGMKRFYPGRGLYPFRAVGLCRGAVVIARCGARRGIHLLSRRNGRAVRQAIQPAGVAR